jgi:uncharacterized protein YjiS (DUF1127 family)
MFNSQSAIAAVRRGRTPGQAAHIASRNGSNVRPEQLTPVAETTEARPATAQAETPWLSVLWLIFEGYALYGASFHGFAVTAANSEVGAGRFREIPRRERRKSISLVSSSARAGLTVLEREDAIERTALAQRLPSAGSGCETPARDVSRYRFVYPGWLTMIWRAIADWWTEWRREREIRQAVAELAEYDDRVLRDMGFPHRSDIERIVRNGRDV